MYPKINTVEVFEAIYDKAGIPFERTKDDVLTLTYKGEQASLSIGLQGFWIH